MIRFFDGFDLSSFLESSLPYDVATYAQGSAITGQSQGQSWWCFNAGFGPTIFTKVLDAQPLWCINIWFRPQITATGTQSQIWLDSEWFRVSDGTGKLFYLRQFTTGHTELRGSADETLLDLGKFTVGEWAAIQIKLQSSGFVVLVNGAQVGAGPVNVWRQPDRFAFMWNSGGGINFDNYVLNDGQGSLNNDFLPYPWAVASRYPLIVTTDQWGNHGFADAVTCVYDHLGVPTGSEYPDGDAGYIQPTGSAQRALFEMQDFVCQGRILAVGLTVVAKPVNPTQSLKLIVEEKNRHTITEPTLAGRTTQIPGLPDLVDYVAYQGIAETDLESLTFWTDGDISRYSWGVESDTTDVRVTQVFLQKVVTLANLPFGCGGVGTYGF